MSTPIILVENLGKKYRLTHQGDRPRYRSLRDVIAETATRPFRRLRRTNQAAGPRTTEEFWALKGVDFEVQQGEVVGIIGRNGAGKSTVLKILSQITEPTTGRVRIRGRLASLLEVGTGFHPELTGRENIYLNGAIMGMARSEIRRKFDEIVAFAEVEKFLDTPVKRYSSGMYVRLAFAVAAHLEPEILVVDEVLAVGDAEFQKKCLGKMRDVSKGGRTVLFVSHNMSAVQSLCGSGMLLDHGQIRCAGPINTVINEYVSSLRHADLSREGFIRLGPSLQLGRLAIHPRVIESGGPMRLDLQLIARALTVIRELAILIYSDSGARVAVLDLRREGLCSLPITPQRPLDIGIFIDKLPLVEGDYRLGFYTVTTDHQTDCPDVALFTVASRNPSGGVVPYAAEYRGFVELDFSVEHQLMETTESSSA